MLQRSGVDPRPARLSFTAAAAAPVAASHVESSRIEGIEQQVSKDGQFVGFLGRAGPVAPVDRVVALWDGAYRRWHRLDAPSAQVPPVLCLAPGRAWRSHRLSDGVAVRRGDPYGELHLDNAAILALRRTGLSPMRLALLFRHEFRASLRTLARLSLECDRYGALVAFSAITIFGDGLARLGFDAEPGGLIAPRITGAYQHALLASLAARPASHRSPQAHRMWISRRRLRALYGPLRRVS